MLFLPDGEILGGAPDLHALSCTLVYEKITACLQGLELLALLVFLPILMLQVCCHCCIACAEMAHGAHSLCESFCMPVQCILHQRLYWYGCLLSVAFGAFVA